MDSNFTVTIIYTSLSSLCLSITLLLRHHQPQVKDSNNMRSRIVQRPGLVVMEFAPRFTDSRERRFDWKNKQKFTLNVAQCGELVGAMEVPLTLTNRGMSSSDAMFRQSELTLSKAVGDQGGFEFQLDIEDLGQQEDQRKSKAFVHIPITNGEFAVIRSLLNFTIPYLLAWDKVLQADVSLASSPSSYSNNREESSAEGVASSQRSSSTSSPSIPAADIWGSHL
mmetsp:Transcript_36248/g.61276  ORF Transcript_36248/g.61276 Transcript_36248/m.61276 type:complete len:224 (-) Transcript_36248:206-877(-)